MRKKFSDEQIIKILEEGCWGGVCCIILKRRCPKKFLDKNIMSFLYLRTKVKGKPMYHKRDWRQYNKQPVNRGKINFWVILEVLKNWQPKRKIKNKCLFIYSYNALINQLMTNNSKHNKSEKEINKTRTKYFFK